MPVDGKTESGPSAGSEGAKKTNPMLATLKTTGNAKKITLNAGKHEHYWRLVFDEREEVGLCVECRTVNTGIEDPLEVVGRKVNLKHMQRLDRIFLLAQSAKLINRCVRYSLHFSLRM